MLLAAAGFFLMKKYKPAYVLPTLVFMPLNVYIIASWQNWAYGGSFGGYGNYDCQGPKSKVPTPAIPLGWPVTAGASDRFIYVGDALNHRVVRVDKKYAAEVTVKVMP